MKHLLILRDLTEKMRERLEWSDTNLLRALLVFLEIQSWMKRNVSGDDSDPALVELHAAIELISTQFRDPLEGLQDEIEDAVDYAQLYLTLESTDTGKCGTTFTFAQLLVLGPTCFCVS